MKFFQSIRGKLLLVSLVLLVIPVLGYRFVSAMESFLREGQGNNLGIGPDYADGLAGEMFNGRKTSIYGGSNEIQRNIIAKAVLGL